jgi:hypothetical protein
MIKYFEHNFIGTNTIVGEAHNGVTKVNTGSDIHAKEGAIPFE